MSHPNGTHHDIDNEHSAESTCCCDCEGCFCCSESQVFIGKKVPNFTASAVMPDGSMNNNFSLSSYLDGNYGLIFFYPLDFTFVCPSEIISFSNRCEAFAERNVKVVGISVDSQFSHMAWRNMTTDKGGIGSINFPLVSDLTKSIASSYGVLIPEKGLALRGSFLVDKGMVLRHITINDLPLGRNADEALRMVDALIHVEKHGEVCPAGWKKGDEGMNPTSNGVSDYLARYAGKL